MSSLAQGDVYPANPTAYTALAVGASSLARAASEVRGEEELH